MSKSKIYNLTPIELQDLLNKSNSYKDVLKYVGINSSSSTQTLKRIISEYGLDISILEENRKKFLSKNAKLKCNNHYDIYEKLRKNTNVNSHTLRIKLIEFGIKENKCENCGISEWLGKSVKFQLHHIDGDHLNNELSNLQILCPNCHSLTDNYGVYNSIKYKKKYYCHECKKEIRKNKTGLCVKCYNDLRAKDAMTRKYNKPIKELCPICKCNQKDIRSNMCITCANKVKTYDLTDIISRNDLKNMIRTNSFAHVARTFQVSDNTIRKWCKKYNLPNRTKDIQQYNDLQWVDV